MKANEATRALTLSILLIAGFVLNVECVASGPADNEFEINAIVETAEEWGVKGIDFEESGEYEKAMECFNRAIEECNKAMELDSNNADAYFFRGSVYGQLKQYEKAIEDFNRVIELNPNDADAYHHRDRAMNESKKQKLAPGFETIFAITGFLAVAYRLRRMR